jgi:RNA polymerase sigma factor (TIGR02999 family)
MADDVTELLHAHGRGDPGIFDRLVPLVYDDLRRVARAQLRRRGPGTPSLDTTGLVHEAYLRLVDQTRATWQDRGHFLAVSAIAMRQILVDHARARSRLKRGGEMRHEAVDDGMAAILADADVVLAVDEALTRLDARLARIVECRYFAGYTEEETAQALKAKADLRRLLSPSASGRDEAQA